MNNPENFGPRICVIGAGNLSSRRILPNIAPAGGILAGICDLDEEKARRNAARFGARAYCDMDAMLAAEKPDGVMVCIGPDAHASLAIRLLRAGYPVYTEKPPAASAAAALEVARVAAETGLLCMTAFKKRYTLAAKRAKEWLAGFPPGDWLSLSMDYCSGAYSGEKGTRGDFLLDFGIHITDLAQFLFGDVQSVFAFARDRNAYAVTLRFENGAVGTLNLNDGRSFTVPTEETEITVKGGNFMTIHNSSVWRITEGGRPSEWREPPTFTSQGEGGRDTGHLTEIEDFVRALEEKRNTGVSVVRESYKSLVLHEAIERSAASGDTVPLRFEEI